MDVTVLQDTYAIWRAGAPHDLARTEIQDVIQTLQSGTCELAAIQLSNIANDNGVNDEISLYLPESLLPDNVDRNEEDILSNRRGFFIPHSEHDQDGVKGIKAATRILGEEQISIVGIPAHKGTIILIEDKENNFDRAKVALEQGALEGDYRGNGPYREITLKQYPEEYSAYVSPDAAELDLDTLQQDHTFLSQTIFQGHSLVFGNPELFPAQQQEKFSGSYRLIAMPETLEPELTGVGSTFLDAAPCPFFSTFNTDFGAFPDSELDSLINSISQSPYFKWIGDTPHQTETLNFEG